MAHAYASIGTTNYETSIVAGHHRFKSDEGAEQGGMDSGPTPTELLCAALSACTAITLRMYAQHKNWPLHGARVDAHFKRVGKEGSIARLLWLDGDLDREQRARLADIAERTPVTLALKQGVAITTTLQGSTLDERLDEALKESFPASDSPAVSVDVPAHIEHEDPHK